MSNPRYQIQNLGAPGKAGQSLFSIGGIPTATKYIEAGWIPCGMYLNNHGEIIQAFYLPLEFDFQSEDEA